MNYGNQNYLLRNLNIVVYYSSQKPYKTNIKGLLSSKWPWEIRKLDLPKNNLC